jgi:hypothetical protein
MLADFAIVIRVIFVPGTWQNKQFHDVLFSHNTQKIDPHK